jgi:hypothetical protein
MFGMYVWYVNTPFMPVLTFSSTFQLSREREERNYYQLERDRLSTFWEVSNKQLDECRAECRVKDRELEEAEERHQVPILPNSYKYLLEITNIGLQIFVTTNIVLKTVVITNSGLHIFALTHICNLLISHFCHF